MVYEPQRELDPIEDALDFNEMAKMSKPGDQLHMNSSEVPATLKDSRQALLGDNDRKGHHGRCSSEPLPCPSAAGDDPDLQVLKQHAIERSEETTATISKCLRVAEDMSQQATKTIVQLHEQGEQIRRTHETALVLDQELSKGEKLLASLGGLFSKPWRPRRSHEITGPLPSHDEPPRRARAALRDSHTAVVNRMRPPYNSQNEQSEFHTQVEMEKAKQDDALSGLSSVLDQLKEMSIDMGSEIQRQNEGLGHLQDDITELESRVKYANERGRQLLHK